MSIDSLRKRTIRFTPSASLPGVERDISQVPTELRPDSPMDGMDQLYGVVDPAIASWRILKQYGWGTRQGMNRWGYHEVSSALPIS